MPFDSPPPHPHPTPIEVVQKSSHHTKYLKGFIRYIKATCYCCICCICTHSNPQPEEAIVSKAISEATYEQPNQPINDQEDRTTYRFVRLEKISKRRQPQECHKLTNTIVNQKKRRGLSQSFLKVFCREKTEFSEKELQVQKIDGTNERRTIFIGSLTSGRKFICKHQSFLGWPNMAGPTSIFIGDSHDQTIDLLKKKYPESTENINTLFKYEKQARPTRLLTKISEGGFREAEFKKIPLPDKKSPDPKALPARNANFLSSASLISL